MLNKLFKKKATNKEQIATTVVVDLGAVHLAETKKLGMATIAQYTKAPQPRGNALVVGNLVLGEDIRIITVVVDHTTTDCEGVYSNQIYKTILDVCSELMDTYKKENIETLPLVQFIHTDWLVEAAEPPMLIRNDEFVVREIERRIKKLLQNFEWEELDERWKAEQRGANISEYGITIPFKSSYRIDHPSQYSLAVNAEWNAKIKQGIEQILVKMQRLETMGEVWVGKQILTMADYCSEDSYIRATKSRMLHNMLLKEDYCIAKYDEQTFDEGKMDFEMAVLPIAIKQNIPRALLVLRDAPFATIDVESEFEALANENNGLKEVMHQWMNENIEPKKIKYFEQGSKQMTIRCRKKMVEYYGINLDGMFHYALKNLSEGENKVVYREQYDNNPQKVFDLCFTDRQKAIHAKLASPRAYGIDKNPA